MPPVRNPQKYPLLAKLNVVGLTLRFQELANRAKKHLGVPISEPLTYEDKKAHGLFEYWRSEVVRNLI